MDSDRENDKQEGDTKSEDGDPLSNDFFIFKPFWIRPLIQDGFRFNRIILDYHRYFLPCCGVISWALFLFFKN